MTSKVPSLISIVIGLSVITFIVSVSIGMVALAIKFMMWSISIL